MVTACLFFPPLGLSIITSSLLFLFFIHISPSSTNVSSSLTPTAISIIYNLPSSFNITCNLLPAQSSSSFDPILISKERKYAWGFAHSPSDGLPLCSLAIVCYSCKHHYPAWSACCDGAGSPFANATSLVIGKQRDLQLVDSRGSLIWSTVTEGVSSIELLETGNLLLIDSRNSLIWQSFEHPGNILLPGQVLTPGMRLIAGDYSAVMETGGIALYVNSPTPLPYLVLNASWGLSTLDGIANPICNGSLSLVYAADGSILMMELKMGRTALSEELARCYTDDPNASTIKRGIQRFNQSVTGSTNSTGLKYLQLSPRNGGLQTFIDDEPDFSWFDQDSDTVGRGFCNVPNHCGEFGICDPGGECRCARPVSNQSVEYMFALDYSAETPESEDCPLIRPADCTQASNYTLFQLQDLEYFPHRYMPAPTLSFTQGNCVESCLQNCTCVTAFYNNKSGACHHYSRTLSMQRSTYGANFLVFIKIIPVDQQPLEAAVGAPEGPSHHRLNFIGVAIIFGTSLLVCSLVFVWVFRMYGKGDGSNDADGRGAGGRGRPTDEDVFLESLAGLPPRYSVKQLQHITNGFSVKLGGGGFGSVYEGSLLDGSRIAVKKLEGTRQGEKEFRAEVAALAGLSHVNLVRLRGFCAEGSQRMLVYEYMINGSLDKWLSKTGSRNGCLDWATRFKVAVGAARGLAFLHGESRERIFHLDVKPQNILLDEHFAAKLADFGLSKQMDRARSRTLTSMRGTPGYLAPEWLLHLAVSDKSDVYSFGMLLLEIVSGRRNVDYSCGEKEKWFWPAWAAKQAAEGRWADLAAEAVYGPVVASADPLLPNQRPRLAGGDCVPMVAPDPPSQLLISTSGDRDTSLALATPNPQPHLPTPWNITDNIGRGTSLHGTASIPPPPHPPFPRSSSLLEAERALKVALWCLEEDPKTRPSMTTVLLMLEGLIKVVDPPLKMRMALEAQAHLLAGFHPDYLSSSSSSSSSSASPQRAYTCFADRLSFNPLPLPTSAPLNNASPSPPCLKPALSI